jgi:tripeptidyl-peptidase I
MSPKYGQYLSLEEIHDLTAPSQKAVDTLVHWLSSNQVSNLQFNDGNAFIRATVPVHVAERLLHIKYATYTHTATGLVAVRAVQPYSLPSEVADVVALVGGVSRFPRMMNHFCFCSSVTPE